MELNHLALAEARTEYQAALAIEDSIKALRAAAKTHRRSAIRLYKSAGLTSSNVRSIMLIPEEVGGAR